MLTKGCWAVWPFSTGPFDQNKSISQNDHIELSTILCFIKGYEAENGFSFSVSHLLFVLIETSRFYLQASMNSVSVGSVKISEIVNPSHLMTCFMIDMWYSSHLIAGLNIISLVSCYVAVTEPSTMLTSCTCSSCRSRCWCGEATVSINGQRLHKELCVHICKK